MKKILVVDDDPDDAEVIAEILKRKDYEVEQAGDGATGLKIAAAIKPALVILDLMMPGMHGFELCERLRSDDKLKDVRIIVISGKRYQVDYRAADRLGANMFIPKPFDASRIVDAVVALIGKPGDPLPNLTPAPGPG